jgi:hypothetical protein
LKLSELIPSGDDEIIESFQVTDKDLIDSIKEVSNAVDSIKSEVIDNSNSEVQPPEITVNSGSDSSMDHYFPEVIKPIVEITKPADVDKTIENLDQAQESPKSGFFNLFSDIKSRRREYGTPNISNVGLPRPELSPLNIPSTSNLPDDNEGIDLEDSNLNKESHQVILPLHD